MSHRDDAIAVVHFYATAPYPCSYLEGHQARSQVAIPADAIDGSVYSRLVGLGFRRSGHFTYRPYCDDCRACVPVRLAAAEFRPSRSQRRAAKAHGALSTRILPLAFSDEHYQLYYRYQHARHDGGGMSDDDPVQYAEFILKSRVDSWLVEFREDGVLRMVSLIDRLDDGLSAVYTFFDPDVPGASYGVYNVLWQVELACHLGLPYVYLGYWIKASPKMVYKQHYRPLQMLDNGRWVPFRDDMAP
ncbi:MAG: arginyltransferase [Vogesella sp.]|jgi:arginine-tRNA-protein transferase|uniref:arginyltransferase n=1 Tax=Vogesella sp. TaxID=1904252 RepID=UPI0011CA684E